MVHWPDNMVTYVAEDKILLSNDAFGQHIASSTRFDDEVGWDILREEAAKYYANIVMPYGDQTKRALGVVSELSIEKICPSHGVIWRSYIPRIMEQYQGWANYETENKALIVYDTMWGSTAKIAYKLYAGLEESGLRVTFRNLKTNHISDIITDLLDSRLILIGSPTLNNGMLPSMGGFLTYLKGLRPKKRIGFAFGSFGWGGQAVGEIEAVMKGLGWEIPEKSLNIKFIPDETELSEVKETATKLGKLLT
jgi:flavorubredoxin